MSTTLDAPKRYRLGTASRLIRCAGCGSTIRTKQRYVVDLRRPEGAGLIERQRFCQPCAAPFDLDAPLNPRLGPIPREWQRDEAIQRDECCECRRPLDACIAQPCGVMDALLPRLVSGQWLHHDRTLKHAREHAARRSPCVA